VLIENLAEIPRAELTIIMDRLLVQAGKEQEWGAPPILDACIAVATADANQGNRLAGFLMERPGQQIQAGIVPKIASYAWARDVFEHWKGSQEVEGPVKKAMEREATRGNVAK
jgi:predicted KAP-like P-loop ATPase